MASIDLNSDLGEGFGPWPMGDDAAMLALVTSANIACGFHAGDPAGILKVLKVAAARLRWEGEPGVFASSSLAERGFCPACGTPLFYRQKGSDWIELTSGSLPPGVAFTPVRQWGLEGRQPWLAGLAIPGAPTTERDVISHQAPE